LQCRVAHFKLCGFCLGTGEKPQTSWKTEVCATCYQLKVWGAQSTRLSVRAWKSSLHWAGRPTGLALLPLAANPLNRVSRQLCPQPFAVPCRCTDHSTIPFHPRPRPKKLSFRSCTHSQPGSRFLPRQQRCDETCCLQGTDDPRLHWRPSFVRYSTPTLFGYSWQIAAANRAFPTKRREPSQRSEAIVSRRPPDHRGGGWRDQQSLLAPSVNLLQHFGWPR